MTTEGTRTYEIVTSRGRQRITVPDTYKVTFGAVVPGSAKSAGSSYNSGGWGLRIWESADKQRAVFSDVVSFRDLSIPLEIAAVREFGTERWRRDDGSYTGKKAATVEKQWMPVDEVTDDPEPMPETVDDPDDYSTPIYKTRSR